MARAEELERGLGVAQTGVAAAAGPMGVEAVGTPRSDSPSCCVSFLCTGGALLADEPAEKSGHAKKM